MLLAKNGFNEQDEKKAINILKNHVSIEGFIEPKEMLDIKDHDGSTPLMQAIIHSNVNIVQTLLELKCDINVINSYGNNCLLFANWIKNKNQKILRLFEHDLKSRVVHTSHIYSSTVLFLCLKFNQLNGISAFL